MTTEELRINAIHLLEQANTNVNQLEGGQDIKLANADILLKGSANQIAVAQVFATLYAAEVVQPYQVTVGSDKYGFGPEKISTI